MLPRWTNKYMIFWIDGYSIINRTSWPCINCVTRLQRSMSTNGNTFITKVCHYGTEWICCVKLFCWCCFKKGFGSVYILTTKASLDANLITYFSILLDKNVKHVLTISDIYVGEPFHQWFGQLLPPIRHKSVRFNTLRPRKMADISQTTFSNVFSSMNNVWIPIQISLMFVPYGPVNNIPALVRIMAWRRPGDKPLSEPMMSRLPTHICVTRPQWVKGLPMYPWVHMSVKFVST